LQHTDMFSFMQHLNVRYIIAHNSRER